jgi:hypothetical protein
MLMAKGKPTGGKTSAKKPASAKPVMKSGMGSGMTKMPKGCC